MVIFRIISSKKLLQIAIYQKLTILRKLNKKYVLSKNNLYKYLNQK